MTNGCVYKRLADFRDAINTLPDTGQYLEYGRLREFSFSPFKTLFGDFMQVVIDHHTLKQEGGAGDLTLAEASALQTTFDAMQDYATDNLEAWGIDKSYMDEYPPAIEMMQEDSRAEVFFKILDKATDMLFDQHLADMGEGEREDFQARNFPSVKLLACDALKGKFGVCVQGEGIGLMRYEVGRVANPPLPYRP